MPLRGRDRNISRNLRGVSEDGFLQAGQQETDGTEDPGEVSGREPVAAWAIHRRTQPRLCRKDKSKLTHVCPVGLCLVNSSFQPMGYDPFGCQKTLSQEMPETYLHYDS